MSIYDDKPLKIKGWTILDAVKKGTTIDPSSTANPRREYGYEDNPKKWLEWWLNHRPKQLASNITTGGLNTTSLNPLDWNSTINWALDRLVAGMDYKNKILSNRTKDIVDYFTKENFRTQMNNMNATKLYSWDNTTNQGREFLKTMELKGAAAQYANVEKLGKSYYGSPYFGAPTPTNLYISNESPENVKNRYSDLLDSEYSEILRLSKKYMNEELDHNKSILLHEFTHALNADPQENTIANILSTDPRVYYNRNFDLNKEAYNNYWLDPMEVYARIMQLRKEANFDPRITITEDMLDESLLAKHRLGSNILRTETLLRLLNEVADNNKSNQYFDLYGKDLINFNNIT